MRSIAPESTTLWIQFGCTISFAKCQSTMADHSIVKMQKIEMICQRQWHAARTSVVMCSYDFCGSDDLNACWHLSQLKLNIQRNSSINYLQNYCHLKMDCSRRGLAQCLLCWCLMFIAALWSINIVSTYVHIIHNCNDCTARVYEEDRRQNGNWWRQTPVNTRVSYQCVYRIVRDV